MLKKEQNVLQLRKAQNIHPTAIVYPGAKLGLDVEVGPYAVIGENVIIGDGTKIGAHVVIDGWTTIGKDCVFFSHSSIGAEPQDLKYKQEKSFLIIGDNTVVRECATINRATGANEETRVGSHCLFMAYTHVAHNCIVGNHVIMSNAATLAGHVVVEDRAVIGGLSGVHQFVKIGRNAMVGGASKIVQDVPPFVIADGRPARVCGMNSVGIARAGIDKETRINLKRAYKIIFRQGLSLMDAIEALEHELDSSEEVEHLLRFLRNAERGICRGRKEVVSES